MRQTHENAPLCPPGRSDGRMPVRGAEAFWPLLRAAGKASAPAICYNAHRHQEVQWTPTERQQPRWYCESKMCPANGENIVAAWRGDSLVSENRHMQTFCIEEAEVKENHRDSTVAKWLESQGFKVHNPEDTWHRVGPWVFVDADAKTYRYCPHYGCGPSLDSLFAGVFFSFEEFKAIWGAVLSARKRRLNSQVRHLI